MICGLRKLAILALASALVLGSASAQESDGLIETYNNAIDNLSAVLEAGADQGAAAFELLSRSSNQLLSLSIDSASESLTAALEQVLERARTAVQNQSQTDLVVQTAVLRGGFQRIVYDSALGAAAQGDLALAKSRLAVLGEDLNLSDETMTAVNEGLSADALRLAMEAGIADVVAQNLDVATRLIEVDTAQAYQVLAVAYGSFLLVQDSPRAQGDMNERFVTVANALVSNETEAVADELSALGNDFVVLENAALTGEPVVEQTPTVEGVPEEVAPEPAGLPTTETADPAPVETQPAETQPVETQPAETQPVETQPVETQPETVAAPEIAATPDTTEGAEGAPALSFEEMAALVAERQRAEQLEALRTEVMRYGVAARTADGLATRLLDNGYTEVSDVIAELYATGAQAAVAVESGNESEAKARIAALAVSYREHLGPIVQAANPEIHSQTEQLADSLVDSMALRLQDVMVLIEHISAMGDALIGVDATLGHNVTVATSLIWNGVVRLVFVIVFGLLAFVPLYLLNLAFGGGNRNWQLVGVALFLLLLPIIYEALAFAFNLIADLTENEAFNVVAAYSMFQSTISQVVWAAVTAAAILFAISGLYGICVQFGLLGRRRGTATVADTRESGLRTGAREPADSLVDWDEEF